MPKATLCDLHREQPGRSLPEVDASCLAAGYSQPQSVHQALLSASSLTRDTIRQP
jgi:hypothetical protein